MSKDKNDTGISMEEIDRQIDEMPVFDLRNPKTRKQTHINIDEFVDSLDLETLMDIEASEDVKNSDNDTLDNKAPGNEPDD